MAVSKETAAAWRILADASSLPVSPHTLELVEMLKYNTSSVGVGPFGPCAVFTYLLACFLRCDG